MNGVAAISFTHVLQLRKGEGFPQELNLEQHVEKPYHPRHHPFPSGSRIFMKEGEILLPVAPERALLVEERRQSRLLYWGYATITSQTIWDRGETWGKFRVYFIHDPFYMLLATMHEFPLGKAYVPGERLLRQIERRYGPAARTLLENRIEELT